MGGSLLSETRGTIDGRAASEWLAQTLAALAATANVRLMPRTQAFGYYAQNFLGLCETVSDPERAAHPDAPRERQWQVRARQVVLACGAIDVDVCFGEAVDYRADSNRKQVSATVASRIRSMLSARLLGRGEPSRTSG